MSDDFDKNDDEMSWLDDDDAPNGDDENTSGDDEDLEFDWDAADDDSELPQSSRLGFTGNLSWRQGDDDDEMSAGDDDTDDDDFGWMTEDDDGENLGGDPSRLGFTGMLSWREQQEQDEGDFGDAGTGDLPDFSFLDDVEEDEDAIDLPSTEDDAADWLSSMDDQQLEPDAADEDADFSFRDDMEEDEDAVDLSFLQGIDPDAAELPPDSAAFAFDEDMFDESEPEPYDEFADLDDLEILRRARTGLTDEVDIDEDADLSFLDTLDEPDEDADDLGFLDEDDFGESIPSRDFMDEEVPDEPEPEGDAPRAGDLGFLDEIEHAWTPSTKDFTDVEEDFFVFDEEGEEEDEGASEFSFLDDFDSDEAIDSDEPEPDIADEPAPPTSGMSFLDEIEYAQTPRTRDFADDPDDEDYFVFGDDDEDEPLADDELDNFLASFDETDEPDMPYDEADDEDIDYAAAFLATLEDDEEDEAEAYDFEDTSGLLADEAMFDDLSDEDFFAEDEEALPEEPEPELAPDYQDLDSLLATFDEGEAALPTTDSADDEPFAFEPDEGEFFEGDADPQSDADPARPDFLEGVMIGGAASSAAAYVRQLENKPDDELDERLFNLRSRGMNIPREQSADPELKDLLPDVSDALSEPQIRFEQENITQDVELSDDQQRDVEMLQGLVASDAMPAPRAAAAIDIDDDDLLGADFIDGTDDEEQPAEQKRRRRRRRGRVAIGRALVGLMLLAAVLAPFFGFGLFGEPPPPSFDQGGEQAAVFENIGTISPRDYVLFAVEYGPTNAAELDPILEATVKHTIAEGGFPVLLGRNAVGISRAEDVMAAIAADEDFIDAIDGRDLEYNDDYYIIGFLPGGEAALRSLAEDPQTVLANNSRGGETDLTLNSLDRLAAVMLLAGSPDDVRLWSEQVAPQTTTPILAGVTRVAEDIARQYLNAPDGLDGLLVSLSDAVTYNQLLTDLVFTDAVALQNVPTASPTLSPTPGYTPTRTPIGFVASATPLDFTPTEVPPDFTPYRVYGIGAFVVTGGGTINVRSGPGTSFNVVGTLAPGEVAIVQGERETDTGDAWTQVLLPGGEQGWVSTALLNEASDDQAALGETQIAQVQPEQGATDAPPTTEGETPTVTPTTTPTEAPSATPTDESTAAQETEEPTVESMVEEATETPLPTDTPTEAPTDAPPTATSTATSPPTDTPPPTNTPPPSATPLPTATPVPQFLEEGAVVRTSPRTSINVRSGPGTDFERIDVVRPNTALLVVGNNEDGTWTEVRLPDGQDGFIFRELLSVVPDAEPPTLAPSATPTVPTATPTEPPTNTPTATPVPLDAEGLVARVTARRPVNVRSGPSRAFQPLGPLNPGQVVNVLGASEDERWLEIILPDGRTGFMIRDAAEVLLGASYLEQATATAEAGGQADVPVEPEDLPATIPPNETEGVPPGRTELETGTTARVRGLENINVREAPAPLARVIGVIPPGGEAPALVLSADQRWVQIQLPSDLTGWVSSSVVFVDEPQAPDTPTPASTATMPPTEAPPTAIQQEGNTAVTEEAVSRSPYSFSRRMQRVRARPPQQAERGEGSGQITAGGVANVRGGPGLTFNVVGTVAPAETVPVLSITDENGGWVEIRLLDGTVGYISAALIDVTEAPSGEVAATEEAPQDTFAAEEGEGVGTVSTEDDIEIYAGPGTAFDVVGTAASDDSVGVRGFETTDDGETWVRVRLPDDTIGYLPSADLVVTQFPELDEPFEGELPAATEDAAASPVSTEETEETEEAAPEATEDISATEEAALDADFDTDLNIEGEGEGVISGEDDVTVYSGPGIEFEVVATASPGDTLPVRGFSTTSTGETWVRVRLPDDTIGYVDASNVTVSAFPEIDEPFEGGDGFGSGTALQAADVRDGPGMAFEVIGEVAEGDILPVRGIEPNEAGETWVRVQLDDDTIGYINANAFEVTRFPAENEPFSGAGAVVATEEATSEPAATEAVTEEAATTTEEATSEPAATEAVTEEAAATEEATSEPVATEAVTEEAVAVGTDTPRSMRVGAFEVEGAGEFNSSLERQEFAVRLGLIVAALIIGIGGSYNAFVSRSRK